MKSPDASPSLVCAALLAAALSLVVGAVRLAFRRVVALDLKLGRGKPGMRRNSATRSSDSRRGEPASEAAPSPPYLADPSSDEWIIGGDPESLPPPRGPAVTTLTFRAYAPPSVDGEIPKVDLYGAMQFVRTGKVQKAGIFKMLGQTARRLLVIDFREMTLAVHVPRRRGEWAEGRGSPFSNGCGRPRPLSSSAAAAHSPSVSNSSRSGIRISLTQIDLGDGGGGGLDEAEGEEVWDPRNFKRVPVRLLCLADIVSISAVPPRRGGVIEVVSRSRGWEPRTLDGRGSPFDNLGGGGAKLGASKAKAMARPYNPRMQYHRQWSGRTKGRLFPRAEIDEGEARLGEAGGLGVEGCESKYYTAAVGGGDGAGSAADLVAETRADEFTFRSPRDAAEFQRIVAALRCVGEEVSHLYEALEAIPLSPSSFSPADPPEDGPGSSDDGEGATRASFISPGVAPEDARGCLDEIPTLRRGLRRLRRLERAGDNAAIGFDGILEESSDLAHARGRRRRLGIVDFFHLFLPPLPSSDGPPFLILPYFAPCAKSESTYLGEDEVMRTRGIECHYRHLALVAALQRLVGRAALHVRAYAWRLHGHDDDEGDDLGDRDVETIPEAADNGSDEMYRNGIDTVLELLDGMSIPLRKRDKTRGKHNQDNQGEIITTKPILSLITRSDVERHLIACAQEENVIKAAVVRIVESATWRGLMFPIDTRTCRIELQSGQFFHQGHDRLGFPIFYFRNMLLGPWRSDIYATTLAVLHRLETYLSQHRQPNLKITVIAIMGHPSELVKAKEKRQADYEDTCQTQVRSQVGADPQLDPHEGYHSHSDPILVHLLSELVPRHYPGRIARVLVLPAGQRKLHIRAYLSSLPKHLNVAILSGVGDLKKYVDRKELPPFAGGNAMGALESFHITGS